MAEPVNLIGERFGNLTVIERAENNNRGNTQWLCKCDCGNTKVRLGYDLTHGRSVTCGCAINRKGKPSEKRKSIVGNKYGKLTVVSLNEEKSKNGVLVWNCVCECGNTCTARGGNLKFGKSTHCGCMKKKREKVQIAFSDISGERFGKLTVISIHNADKGEWNCKCDCGNDVIYTEKQLKSGTRKSCGCLSKRKRSTKRRLTKEEKHIQSEWYSMRGRCSENYHGRRNYYDRGITICDEWDDFDNFEQWALSNGYSRHLTLDRINPDKGYSPENCRWVTMKEQQNNKRNNVRIEINGATKTLKQWSEFYNLPYGTVKMRKRKGWGVDRLFEPVHKN